MCLTLKKLAATFRLARWNDKNPGVEQNFGKVKYDNTFLNFVIHFCSQLLTSSILGNPDLYELAKDRNSALTRIKKQESHLFTRGKPFIDILTQEVNYLLICV